jgi:hypothetical protein
LSKGQQDKSEDQGKNYERYAFSNNTQSGF